LLATAPAPEVDFPRPTYARWGLDYWQQRADRRIVLGGCRDVGGDAEWTTDDRPTESVQTALTALLRQRLHVKAEVTHRWAATVAYTQSGLPILEQVRPRVWAIGAYSGTGTSSARSAVAPWRRSSPEAGPKSASCSAPDCIGREFSVVCCQSRLDSNAQLTT
jgi:glycine/D-amino acid oxidase-like deaminating enzyme